jgi:hypothetical protein
MRVCWVPAGDNLYHIDKFNDIQRAFLVHQGVSQGVGKRDFLSDSSLSTYDIKSRFRFSAVICQVETSSSAGKDGALGPLFSSFRSLAFVFLRGRMNAVEDFVPHASHFC